MCPAADLPESLFTLREISREIAERSASIRADAARTRATSQNIIAAVRAARDARVTRVSATAESHSSGAI
jgi:hypothetical protein